MHIHNISDYILLLEKRNIAAFEDGCRCHKGLHKWALHALDNLYDLKITFIKNLYK